MASFVIEGGHKLHIRIALSDVLVIELGELATQAPEQIIHTAVELGHVHIMKKSPYSGMFGDYSSFSEEYEEMSDANWEADEEESEDEK